MTWRHVLYTLAAVAGAQSVISTHAGLIHFFEGAVFVNNRPLEAHLGKFTNAPQGAELRTEQGRAEMLLTPGVFLRVGEKSAIRMAATELADTQVELLSGSAMLQAGEQNKDTAVTVTYGKWKAHFPQKGLFRIDSDPPRLWALRGSAEVDSVKVEAGMDLPLAAVLVPEQSGQPPSDSLSDWSRGRSQSIVADNAITAQIDEDPPELGAGLDNFVYYPMLGLGSSYSSLYSPTTPYQPGFSSIYLPGYSYQPIFIGVPFSGISVRRPVIGGGYIPLPIRIGTGIGTGVGMPRQPQPIPRPAPIHVGAPIRVGGGHR